MRGSAATADTPLIPARVGRYEILLPIASGGMATVYLARARGASGFEREVALKLTHTHLREEESFAHDLVEEAKLASRIRHPNVVSVNDVGDDPVGVYLVMDYIEGETLSGLLRLAGRTETPLPINVSLRVVVDALAGLHAAHELTDDTGAPLGLVHRDFSPQNILVGLDGCPRLADFGVAKAATRLGHTKTGLVKGKIHYMSPEQVRSNPIDRRCDIWAAGILVWELVARRRIYEDLNDTGTILQIVSRPPPRVSTVRPDVPAALDAAIAHALRMDPGRRCPTAAELARELADAATGAYALASPAEVAAHVRRIAGPALARRRERIAELLRLRAQMGELASTEVADQPTPSSSVRRSRPTGDTAVESSANATSPVVAPTVPAPPAPPPRRSSRPLVVGATAVLTLALGAMLWRSAQPPPADAAAAPAAQAASVPTSTAAADEPPAASSEPAAPSPPAAPVSLTISATAPVATLQIGDRIVAIALPATTLAVDLVGDEGTHAATVVATSTDGRRLVVTLEQGARSLELAFAAPSGAVAARGGGPGAKKPDAPARPPAPLAPSPYEKK